MENSNHYTSSMRIANFTNIQLQDENQLSFNTVVVEKIVEEVRKYADLPYIFLVSAEKSDLVSKILTTLKEMKSPCYPYAIITLDALNLGNNFTDLDILRSQSHEANRIVDQIQEYSEKRLKFHIENLHIQNPTPIPDQTDVVIIGAGATGIYAADRLKKSNISFCLIDKRDKIGGIWSMYANTTSRVNSSEASYRLTERVSRSNRDHSATRELLEDFVTLSKNMDENIYLETEVQKVEKIENGYKVIYKKGDVIGSLKSKGIILAINDRVGAPRHIEYSDQSLFQGQIVSGFSDKAREVNWKNKNVVIVGMGAFAIGNARTALEFGANHVTIVCRRHGTVCPKIIDYLNFATPYDENFQHDKKSNTRNMMYWKKLYDTSGATQPECWMGNVKHEGHTISVSDIWFIGHFLKKIETKLGSITSLYDKGVILDNGQKLNTDVIVNCVGFEKNGANAKEICGYKETYNNNYVDKDFMYLADAYIDDEAFNSFFGSSVLEMVKFYMELFVKYFDNPSYYKMIEIDGINKLPLDDRRWSHYIKAATSLIQNDADLYQIAKKQVDNRTKNFLEKHDLKTYLAENKREWIDIHSMLTGKKMTEDQCLPYVFEKLRPK